MAEQIIVIAKVEDDSYKDKAFKKVTDKAGDVWKIKTGREDALKKKWPLLVPGKTIKLTMGDYQGHPFVENFEVVEGSLVETTQGYGERKPTWQGGDSPEKRASIERQSCLERAVELAITGIFEDVNTIPQIILTAQRFYDWVSGKVQIYMTPWIDGKTGLKAETPQKEQPAPAKTSESQSVKPSKATKGDDLFDDTPGLDTVKLQADFRKLKPDKRAALVLEYGITSWEHWDEVILALPADRQQALMKAVYEKETK